MLETTITESVTKFLGNVPEFLNSLRHDSLPEATQSLRIEPIVVVDTVLQGQEFVSPLLQNLTNIYSGYILQAFALSATIGNISVSRHLDRIQPNRKPIHSLIGTVSDAVSIGNESYRFGLPDFKNPNLYHGSLEADDRVTEVLTTKDAVSQIRDAESLAVGKMLEVTITAEDKSIKVPIMVRLNPVGITPDVVTTVFALDSRQNTVKERYHRWKSGELEFLNDIVFCNDLIDAHRSALRKDKSGFYRSVLAARRNNRFASILSGTPSINAASNIAILSSSTAQKLEVAVGGPLKDADTRQRIFSTTSLMMMVVCDTEWEQMVIYHRGIETPTELNFRDSKALSKNAGPDINEILKAYSSQRAPTF